MGKVAKVAVMQTHAPGAESEVDFGEFWAIIDGVNTKLWMFVMRLSFSGKAIRYFSSQVRQLLSRLCSSLRWSPVRPLYVAR